MLPVPPLNAPPPPRPGEASRRTALRLLAASLAGAAGACGRPAEEIVPTVRAPEHLLPGVPRRYATALPHLGYGRGVHAVLVDGRPIKVEGNPLHPASLGATDVLMEAAVLDLWDPDRSRTPVARDEGIASLERFRRALAGPLAAVRARRGAGFHLVTGRVTSPTLARQIAALFAAMPEMSWHADEPADSSDAGAALAFGRRLTARPALDRADSVLAIDADPLGSGPDALIHARAFGARRRPQDFLRLACVEAAPTLTGLKADARLLLPPAAMPDLVAALARALGAEVGHAPLGEAAARFVADEAARLRAGRGLVLGGETLPPESRAAIHWINARLGAPVEWIDPLDRLPGGREPTPLASLAAALDAGRVEILAVLDRNPAYDAPADLDLAARIGRAAFSVQVGPRRDETGQACRWHLPLSHPFEGWSDLRGPDGTAAIVQPVIRPLYGTLGPHEALGLIAGAEVSGHALVRETWAGTWRETWRGNRADADFEAWWRGALHDGVVPGTAAPTVRPGEPRPPVAPPAAPITLSPAAAAADLTLVLRPDPCLLDGRHANNAWLQECPKPITKGVWGNALALGPAEAGRRNLLAGDVVRVEAGGRALEVPVAIVAGHADGVASLELGHGRIGAGRIGDRVGANAFALATTARPRVMPAALTPLGRRADPLTAANPVRIEGDRAKLFPVLTLAAPAIPRKPEPPSLMQPWRGDADGHAWGMVIDTAACIGCNACVVACQAENNVPVVGPDEVARGRIMHWLRVDLYEDGPVESPRGGFQPVPCMHCEQAPCEPVCPVAASVHDGEGLNVQVYNRCVGTRFCQANCPYKVRRFNFFGYADGQEVGGMGAESVKAGRNPNVTVRARGVMEKCTYCVQRIAGARQAASARQAAGRDERPMEPVVTACQAACPTRAITFGDLARPDSEVARKKADPRHYALLEELNTRPRTTYLADLRDTGEGRG
jgi:Fe-S-cluster-containing dehydrogenase component